MSDEVPQSASTNGSGQSVVVRMVATDKPLITAIAIALGLINLIWMSSTTRDVGQLVYWTQREETFLEQLSTQRIQVPPDILDHIKKEHEK